MKKTIIALLALSGVALGADSDVKEFALTTPGASFDLQNDFDLSQNWELEFNLSMSMNPESSDSVTLIALGDAVTVVATATGITVNDSEEQTTGTGYWYAAGQMASKNYFTLTYTAETSTLTVVVDDQNATDEVYGTFSFTLGLSGATASVVSSGITSEMLNEIGGWSNAPIWSLPAGSLTGSTIEAGVPSTPAIPEPTTATLSLLALAGLAARRRRK